MNKQELFVELAQSMKNLQLPQVRLYHFLADHDLFHYTFSSLYIIFISSYTISFNKKYSLQGKQLFTTKLDGCIAAPAGADISALAPCTHEEADTRMMLHVAAAASAGHRRQIIRSSDSDVVVLAVWTVAKLEQEIDELWVALGSGNHFRYLHSKIVLLI